jgi:hypothetical protein
MKANLKGLGGIKGLLLLHGEKVAMTIVGLLVLWFIYSSLQLPSLEDNRQATNLQAEIQQTNAAVTQSEWPQPGTPQAAEIRVVKPTAKSDFAVDPEDFVVPGGLNPPVVASTDPRMDPVLLNALEIRAVGGTGLFAFIDAKVQQARALAAAQRQAEQAQQQQEELDRQQRAQNQGRNQGGYGEGIGGRGAYGEGGAGTEYDPDHPKRRPVEGMARPAGVPLQGDERIERVHWAVVTAKVPVREQLKLYQDAFQNARGGGFDPARDFPRYIGYFVQRAEIVRGKELEWKAVGVYDGQKESLAKAPISSAVTLTAVGQLYKAAATKWAGQVPDVVDARYQDYVLTLPLPPLVGRDWAEDATHPDIPLAINTPPLEEQVVPLEEEPTEEPAEGDDMPNFRANTPDAIGPGGYGAERGRMGGGRGYGGYGGEEGTLGGGYGGYGSGGRGIGGYGEGGGRGIGGYGGYGGGRGIGGYGGEGGGGRAYGGAPSTAQRTSLPTGVDHLLLRFFDFSVEPGKRYKYRVRLVLADPNSGLEERVLDSTVLDRQAKEWADDKARGRKDRRDYRMIEEWSEPSRTVGIPLEGGVRLAETKPAAEDKPNDEPVAKLLVESFDLDADNNAIQAATEKDLRRGYVANFIVKDQEYLGPGGIWIDTMESFKFYTGITLLDMEGGEQLAKDNNAPARVLLMDPAGELHIRRELDDKPAVSYHRLLFQKDRRRGRDGEMETSPYGGGEGRGGYGGYR